MSLITEIDILQESKDCFLTFAAEVLTDRAIPAAEDGLLSSQRKILWTMEDHLKMNNKSKTKKCNALVGSTLATSYFHGDAACYGVLCKMSQEFLMRYPLIQGQGSLGTQESNDMVASSRYTEAKPSKYADLMMNDYNKGVVPTKETYNGEYYEPVVLPSLFPNALCNGKQAIGVSMAHNSQPHNLTEVCNAIVAYIKNQGLTIDELLTYVPGPDFPLENVVINSKDVRIALATGRSSVSLKVRGIYDVKGQDIIFRTIPYRTYRDKIKEQINKNIEVISEFIEDFDDESGLGINKLIFHVKKGIDPERAVLKLFALTDLQTTISYNMNYIVNGTPKLCSFIDLIEAYYNHQTNVFLKATEYDKKKAEEKLHILKGLYIAVQAIDMVIELIKGSKDKAEARNKLIDFLKVTEIQANAILDMKLSKLTKLDSHSIEVDIAHQEEIILECEKIITNREYRDSLLITKIEDMKSKYGDERRTLLLNIEVPKEEKAIEMVTPEDVVVVTTEGGNIKRVPKNSFRVQKKNGKGVKTQDDITKDVIRTNTIDNLLIFSDAGKVYKILVDNIPEGNNTAKGVSIKSLISSMDNNEKPVLTMSITQKPQDTFLVFITKQGTIKKTALEDYLDVKKKTGVIAIKLREGDELAGIDLGTNEDYIIVTKNGMSIRTNLTEVPISSRATIGVKGIKLKENDEVISIHILKKPFKYLANLNKNGSGKKVDISEFPTQGRAGVGVQLSKTEVADSCLLTEEASDCLICAANKSICISSDEIPKFTRGANGNQLIKNDRSISITRI